MKMNYFFQILTVGLSTKLLLTLCLPTLAKSVLKTENTSILERIIFQENFNPPGQGKPKKSSSAGTRNGLRCSRQEETIQSLMPQSNYGLTLQERPTIFVNLPKTKARQVLLVFKDETGQYYERQLLPITKSAGIVDFTLPQHKQPLEVGKNYQWLLAIICGKTLQPDDPILSGWVQRVVRTTHLENQLKQKTYIQLAAWYGARGYWYDMIKTIIQAKLLHPNDVNLTKIWRDLLDSQGLILVDYSN
jgi:hypothetical protein